MMEIGTIVTINEFKDACKEYQTAPVRKNKRRMKNLKLYVISCLKEEKRQKHISQEEYDTYIAQLDELAAIQEEKKS
jgi:hypothetical protein